MSFEAHYPSGGSYTTHFAPNASFAVSGSSDKESDGISAKLAADGRTLWAQQFGDPAIKYVRTFAALSLSERAQLRAFKDVVKGDAFDFIDGACGPITSTKKVKFAPEGYVLEWSLKAEQRQGVTLVMVEAD